MLRILLLIVLLTFGGVSAGSGEEVLKLATTTSTYETGRLDHIFPPFEKKHKVKVHIISVGTGKAIKLGENGDVDIILVHARAAEDKFVAGGYGVNRRDVMYNDFLILGPAQDPADLRRRPRGLERDPPRRQRPRAVPLRGRRAGGRGHLGHVHAAGAGPAGGV